MFKKILDSTQQRDKRVPREGELYRTVTTFGKTFELRYGFYDDRDRLNPLCEPAVIYPDFFAYPMFTDGGHPFVTVMQDACDGFLADTKRTADTTCAECKYFIEGEDWFGICTNEDNRRNNFKET